MSVRLLAFCGSARRESFSRRLLAVAVAFTLPAQAGKRDNSVKWASNQVPESLDAYFNNVRIGVILAHHIWDTLIYRDPKTNQYRPSLATAWRWVDDKTLEFDLRKGVKFHLIQHSQYSFFVFQQSFQAFSAQSVGINDALFEKVSHQ